MVDAGHGVTDELELRLLVVKRCDSHFVSIPDFL